MIKPLPRILVVSLIAVASWSCGRQTNTGTAPSNTNANGNQANRVMSSSGPGARLDRFVGSWGGYAGKTTRVSGQIGIDSRWMKTNVKQVAPDAVALEGDIWQAKGTFRYDATSQKYLLSVEAEDFPKVTNLPMTFSEAGGFSGSSTFSDKGKEFKAKATIKDDKGASEWHVDVTQGKDMWILTIRLGKDE